MTIGIDLGYFAYKMDGTDATPEDVDYIVDKLADAMHDRRMTFGGGAKFAPVEGEEDD